MANYNLMVGEKGNQRLTILNELCNPRTLSFVNQLGNFSGKKIVDLGCGNGLLSCEFAKLVGADGSVVAIDNSLEQLQVAKKNAELQQLNNITFIHSDANNLSAINDRFDMVYCRFLLAHLTSAISVVNNMVGLLNSNGWLVCEELINLTRMFCFPESMIFQRWHSLAEKLGHVNDSDSSIAQELYPIFQAHQLQDIKLEIVQPALVTERQKQLLPLALQEMMPALALRGFATEEVMQALMVELQQFSKNSRHALTFHQYLQIAGKKN